MSLSPTDPDLVVVVAEPADASSDEGSDGSGPSGSADGPNSSSQTSGDEGSNDASPGGRSGSQSSDSQSSSGEGSSGEGSGEDGGEQDKNWLEWVVFGIGLAITLGVIGYLGYQVVAGTDEPAQVRITVQELIDDGDFVLIPIEARNEGDHVAEAATVEVCAGPESCGEVSFSYIPKGSTRSGIVGLNAPLEAPVTTRVVSYRKP